MGQLLGNGKQLPPDWIKMHLKDTAIRTAKPAKKAYKLSDVGSLFLLVFPSWGKWWRYKYLFNGKENLLYIGIYPDTSLKDSLSLPFPDNDFDVVVSNFGICHVPD